MLKNIDTFKQVNIISCKSVDECEQLPGSADQRPKVISLN